MIDRLPEPTKEQMSIFPCHYNINDFQKIKYHHPSPSGKFYLATTDTIYPEEKGYWGICRGAVLNDKGEIAIDIIRNYAHFPFAWYSWNQEDMIVMAPKYYQICIYSPRISKNKALVNGSEYPDAFCPGSFEIGPDQRHMVVSGCHWAGPWEYLVLNLDNVFRGLLSCISNQEIIVGDINTVVWDDNSVTIKTKIEIDDDKWQTDSYCVPLWPAKPCSASHLDA